MIANVLFILIMNWTFISRLLPTLEWLALWSEGWSGKCWNWARIWRRFGWWATLSARTSWDSSTERSRKSAERSRKSAELPDLIQPIHSSKVRQCGCWCAQWVETVWKRRILFFLMSFGVSEGASERMSAAERASKASSAEQANERTKERISEWPQQSTRPLFVAQFC